MASPPPRGLPMPLWGAALLLLALLSSAVVAVSNVWPVLNGAAKAQHAGHWGWVRLHTLMGVVMLISGPLNLYVGQTRRWFDWHRHIGCTYIGTGYTATLAALAVTWQDPHGNPSIALSTSLLAVAWMVTASMGWRTGAQRRWGAHVDWMVRSYVLTWSFVLCRLVQRGGAGLTGGDGERTALLVWLSWVGPLLICEIVLRWRATATARGGRQAG